MGLRESITSALEKAESSSIRTGFRIVLRPPGTEPGNGFCCPVRSGIHCWDSIANSIGAASDPVPHSLLGILYALLAGRSYIDSAV